MTLLLEKETTTTTITNTKYQFFDYENIVLLIITQTINKKERKEHFLIKKDTFKQNQNNKSINWVYNLPNLTIISPEYLNYYQKGSIGREPKIAHQKPEKWAELLTNGTAIIVNDRRNHNGFIYDINGNVILKAFHFNYIDSQLNSKTHYIGELLKHLKKQKYVTEIKAVKVPYFNEEGGTSIEFVFTPTKQIFQKLMQKFEEKQDNLHAGTYEIRRLILERLNVNHKKFRKTEPEPEFYDDEFL